MYLKAWWTACPRINLAKCLSERCGRKCTSTRFYSRQMCEIALSRWYSRWYRVGSALVFVQRKYDSGIEDVFNLYFFNLKYWEIIAWARWMKKSSFSLLCYSQSWPGSVRVTNSPTWTAWARRPTFISSQTNTNQAKNIRRRRMVRCNLSSCKGFLIYPFNPYNPIP